MQLLVKRMYWYRQYFSSQRYAWPLTPQTKVAADNILIFFLLSFEENKAWFFMWILCLSRGFTWNIKSYFLWKTMKKYLWMLSAAVVIGTLRVKRTANHEPLQYSALHQSLIPFASYLMIIFIQTVIHYNIDIHLWLSLYLSVKGQMINVIQSCLFVVFSPVRFYRCFQVKYLWISNISPYMT